MNWKWRDYQANCFQLVLGAFKKGIDKQLIVQATGLGKRSQAVWLAGRTRNTLFLAHNEELIDQAVEDFSNIYGFTNVGIIKGNRMELDKRFVVASPQTLYNRLTKIRKDQFSLVQVDECFKEGTLIDNIEIENIKIGDYVSSFNHDSNTIEKRKVIKTIERTQPFTMYDFENFSCTGNHPIFIKEIGYCLAKEIYIAYICHISMCYLYETILFKYLYYLWNKIQSCKFKKNLFEKLRNRKKNNIKSKFKIKLFELWSRVWLGKMDFRQDQFKKKQKNIHSYDFKRFWMLFSKMQKGIFQQYCEKFNNCNKQERCIYKNEEKQSYVSSRNQRENDTINERKNISFSWWKRTTNKTSNINSSIHESSDGICNKYKWSNIFRNFFTTSLQSRFSRFRLKIGNRNRWKIPQIKTLEILRQKKDNSFEFVRLDCSKIHKRTSGFGFRKCSRDNFVYNLEIEGNNNYFANGVLVHNCHHYMARTFYATVQHFNAKRLLWTATPNRLDGLSLMDLADEKTFEYNIIDGIRNGYLAELDGIRIKTEISLDSVSKKMGDFDERQLSNAVDIPQRNMLVVNSYQKYANERQFVAFCVDTQHAIHLADYFRDRKISVEIISSDLTVCPDRKGSINRFKTGRVAGLINVNILTEGFDYYDVGAILMVRPTQSQTLYFQAIGRGTRVKTEEFFRKFKSRDCKILDFVDNTSRHKLVNSFELDRSLPASSKMFVTTEKRDKLIGAENDRREAKITTRVLQDEYVNLTALPRVNIFNSPKMHDPATDKQLAFLQSLGIYSDSDNEGNPIMYTKLMATELINSAPAEAYMVRQLLQWGFNPNGATVGQFMMVKQNRQIKERINGNRFLPKN